MSIFENIQNYIQKADEKVFVLCYDKIDEKSITKPWIKESVDIMKKWIHAFLLCLFVCLSLAYGTAAHASEARDKEQVLTVAFPEADGINMIYEDGTYGGTTYECLMEVAKYTGWKYEFVTGDAEQLLSGMMSGEYDLMGGMFYQKEWEEYFNYPKYVMCKNYSALLCHNDNRTAKQFDLSTLNGMTIGVFKKANSKISRLKNFLTFNNIDCQLVYYEDSDEHIKCLENNEVDLMLGNITDASYGYNVVAKFESDPYYLVTAKSRPDLRDELSMALTEIYTSNPNFIDEMYDKYFPDNTIAPIDFNEADLKYIEEEPTIRVAVLDNYYPIYYTRDNEYHGIVPDLFKLIADRTGLAFEFIPAKSYQQVLDLAKNGQADVVGCYMDNAYAADNSGLTLTKSYASLDSIILKNKGVTYPSEELIMAVPKGRSWKSGVKGGIETYYETYEACLEAVDTGEADFMRLPSAFVEYLFLQDYYPNIIITATSNLEIDLSIALPAPMNIELYSLLNKAVNNLTQTEINDLLSANLVSSGEQSVSLKYFIYTNSGPVLVFCICFFSILLVIILLAAKYKTKNKVMQIRIEKIEETARLKSEFLSRMSHEIRTPLNAILGLTSLTQMSCELTSQTRQNLEKIDTSAQFLLSLVNDILDMSKIDSCKMKIENNPFELDTILNEMENIFNIHAQQNGLVFRISKDYDKEPLIGDEIRIKQVLTNLLSNACKFTDRGGSVTLSVKQIEKDSSQKVLFFSVKDTGIGISREDTLRIFDSFEQVSLSRRNTQGTGLGLSISSRLVELMGSRLQVKSNLGEGSEFYFSLTLPISKEPEQKSASPGPSSFHSLEGMHVLLAEDNDLNAEIAISILELKGVHVERVCDGEKAVEQYLSKPPWWFDLILMDIQMPIKDGLTACGEIRAMDRPDAKTIPIVAMTANTFQDDRENASAAGMTGFVPKPFNIEQLYQTITDTTENEGI